MERSQEPCRKCNKLFTQCKEPSPELVKVLSFPMVKGRDKESSDKQTADNQGYFHSGTHAQNKH